MKGLYIHDIDFKINSQYSGVKNKIEAQIRAFKNNNITMDLIMPVNNQIVINNREIGLKIDKYRLGRFKNNMMFILLLKYISLQNKINIEEYDIVYIRFSMANIGMLRFVKYLKSKGIKVIIEIPTYPYENELKKNLYNRLLVLIDRSVWKRINPFIFRIAVTTDISELYGIKTINIYNGVDLDMIPIADCNNKDGIMLVGVANINKWHGYDRVINGLSDYYKIERDNKVYFNIIGEGSEKDNLIKLVNELKLNEYINFLGSKIGNELDYEMNKANIGISSLALYRAGGGHDPIKTKEFIARGIPVILGYYDKLVDMNLSYVIKIDENDTPVDIERIVEIYENLKVTKYDIRKYAENYLSWDSQIKKIVQCINNDF